MTHTMTCDEFEATLPRLLDGELRLKARPFWRFAGQITGYVGEGAFTNDPLHTFGGAGVVEIPKMQKLLRYICETGFEHHVAANLSTVASAVHEASTRYFGWDMYWHERNDGNC